MTQKDYYQVLGVERNASDDEIKKKYHLLAKKFHPDKNADDSAEEKFKEINRAYEAIRDAESRQSYELQRRGEEMEARANNMAANPTQYTFRRPGRGFMGGFGFTADDLNDVFSRTFRERNKENTRPSDRSSFRHTFDFGRPEWDSNYNESGTRAGGDDFTFSFSFGGEPQQPRRNRMGDVDDLFEDFFQDPFFMDSFPFSGGPDLGGNRARQPPRADNTSQKSTPRASSEDDIGSARARAEREEVLRKAARDEEARQARDEAAKKVQEAAKKAQEARRKETQRKAEEERMHDWKNDKAEAAGENNNYDTGMKLACNYCNQKFHAAALSAHERICRSEYYGKMDRDDSPSPPPPSAAPPPPRPDFSTRVPPTRAHSFAARGTAGAGAGASGASFKDDLLKSAYLSAAKETLRNMQTEKPPPQADFQRCEYCGQSFSPTVAKYHIPFCGRKHGSGRPTTDTGASRTTRTEFSAEEPTYRSTYRTTQGPRPSPSAAAAAATAAAAGASAFDRINSPSFTNLGANLNRPRPATTTTTSTDEPYGFTQPLGSRVTRGSGSTTRIRYVPAASRVRTSSQVGK